ncbi:hypothetical protein L226DRAFT_521114 [Lentinus tigrinus ALCF2SS1-7]|uniref:uncharacterized protein n=1 Tax=Lentinus tigrinus ALCF2SS1-7 TaxID=1328758 RepID=UPI001165FFBE|nr:hypothetical protein L226DRAFT_521114 [Lentinus tigrinus ALCF2SS1-7]
MAMIDSTFGAALIGLIISACLYGITLLQTFSYFRNYSNDSTLIKSLSVGFSTSSSVHKDNILVSGHQLRQYQQSGHHYLEHGSESAGSCKQTVTFFARRVWMMSRNWLITGIIVVLAFLHFVFTAESFILGRFSKFKTLTWVTCLGLGSAAAADIIIAIAMCYYLYTKRTGLKRTDSVVALLMVYSVNSGLTTSIIATICVVTFAAMPTNFVWLSFFWIMGKCYVNSFLALLNSRESLRDKVAGAVQLNHFGIPHSFQQSFSTNDHSSKAQKSAPRLDGVAVSIETITDYSPHYPRKSTTGDRQGRMEVIQEVEIKEHSLIMRDDDTSCCRLLVLCLYLKTFKMSLRDKLLAALADLPGTRTFHVHVLTSAPRKHNGLFPYAHPRPRTYLQEVFILLSEQTTPDAPHVLVTAIEASVYNIPSTSSGIVYISKVDSSGHASAPSPTATLVRAFLTYYADPVTRPIAVQHLWIQLFARAQNQYLFPNSSEYEGKHPLSDVKLCAWWRKVYSEVAGTVNTGLKGVGKVKLFYILPGYSELEAAHSLTRGVTPSSSDVPWVYGHPYSQTEIPLPCPKNTDPDAPHNLGHFIPWFDDDPKSRFIDEIAYIKATEGGIRSPKRKRAPSSTGGDKKPQRRDDADDKEKEKEREGRPQGELAQVTADEFWERMSFRQECVAGAVTGFFTMCVSTPPPVGHDKTSQPSPLAPQPGQVSSKMVRRIVASLMNHHEFSTRERAVRATETLEGVIKGLCDDAPAIPASAPPSTAASAARSSSSPDTERPRTPEPDRPATLDVPRTPPPKRSHLHLHPGAGKAGGVPEISPNPFPDPVPSPETYTDYIYGRIEVRNAPLPPRGGANGTASQGAAAMAPVTVLAVRKKRKPAPP